jgi:hypothetical protein
VLLLITHPPHEHSPGSPDQPNLSHSLPTAVRSIKLSCVRYSCDLCRARAQYATASNESSVASMLPTACCSRCSAVARGVSCCPTSHSSPSASTWQTAAPVAAATQRQLHWQCPRWRRPPKGCWGYAPCE